MSKMKILVISAALLAASVFVEPASAAPVPAQAAQQGSLEQVIALLNRASQGFQSVQTPFTWDQYQAVVGEHDVQAGVIYFRRAGQSVEMAADIQTENGKPAPKYVLFTGGVVQVHNIKADEVQKFAAGKNQQEFESYLVLGFGGRGSDLEKNFAVRYAGVENLDGKPAYKLELTPKSEKVLHMFPLITLWIDQQSGMSVQQRFQQGEGDYRLARYTNIQVNKQPPPSAFKLKTTSRTKFVTMNR